MTAYWPNGTTYPGVITDRYGPRPPINNSRPFHYGTDVDTDAGDIIHAAMDGTVIFSGGNGSLGQQVVIQCDRYQFLYPHNEYGSLARVGQKVKAKQGLAVTGLTGNTTGYHSCFRVFEGDWRRDADARDPEQIMARLNGGAPASTIRLGIFLEGEQEDMKVVLHRETGGVYVVDREYIAHMTSMTDAQYVANVFTAEDEIIKMNTAEFQATLKGLAIPFEHPDRLRLKDPGKSWSRDQEIKVGIDRVLTKLGA